MQNAYHLCNVLHGKDGLLRNLLQSNKLGKNNTYDVLPLRSTIILISILKFGEEKVDINKIAE